MVVNVIRPVGWLLVLAAGAALGQRAEKRDVEETPAQAMVRTAPAKEVMAELFEREKEAVEHRNMYTYISNERSERTGGHLWTERVVECPMGHVRKLTAIDGKPLTAEQEAQERGRLAEILRNPAAFERHEQDREKDEQHARQMLQLLDRAFLFENMRVDGEDVKIDFKPNPAYQPQSMEERVLHAMVGTVTVEPKTVRMRRLEARLPQDVNIGYGLLAKVRAGTRFSTEREMVASGEWKGTVIDTHVDGHILFFKTLSKNEHAVHGEFERVANDLTLAQAVARAEE